MIPQPMLKILIIAISVMMITVATITITSVYATSPISLCSEYGGDWSNDKCRV